MSIPDIKRNPRGWFQYFDRDRSGRLDQGEVINAFSATFGATCDPTVLTSVVQQLWPLFDRDGTGVITENEFLAREGLCDTILAQFPSVTQSFVEVDPSHPPGAVAGHPPHMTGTTLHCWSCQQRSTVQPPRGIIITALCS